MQFTKGLTISQLRAGKRPTFPTLIKEEVKDVSITKGIFRIKTGTFPTSKAFAEAIDKIKSDFGMVIYEAAEDIVAKIKAKYGWTTYLIDETK